MANTGSQTSARPRPTLLKIIATILLVLIVLVGLAALIIWLTLKPKHLKYTIEDGSIQGFNLSDSNHLTANFNFVLKAYNPNKKVSIHYDRMEVKVLYDDQTVATGFVNPFFQPHKNVTLLGLKLAANDVSLYSPVAKSLKLERSSGKVELKVKVKAKIRLKVGGWKSRHRKMKVSCDPVVYFSSSKGTFQRNFCDVDL